MRSTARVILSLIPVLALALAAPAPARAQYFGRNAVQWDRLKFEVLKTQHFDIYYYPEEQKAAEEVGRLGERWYTRLSTILHHQMKDRQPVVLYASSAQFQQTNTLGSAPGEGTGGVTEAFKRRIVLPVGASLAETDHVFGHELVHAFQYSMTGQGRISDSNFPSALRMPLWFIEGMAEYLSLGPEDPHTAMWLRDAARKEKGLPTIRQLDNTQKYFPYRYGQALWAYLASRYGDDVFARMLRGIRPNTNDAEDVIKYVLHVDPAQLSKDWHASIRQAYAATETGKKDADAYGPALVTERKQGGRLNVGPVLSPDGNHLAFLSERELFSVELFLEDTRNGNVTKQLSRTVVDPHLESLEFINSAGSWDSVGRRFVLGAQVKGRAALLIVDALKGGKTEIPIAGLGEIDTPSFSPDGRRVVFSGLSGGFTDLFVYDLESKALRHLTEDAYADLQPVWSPDGHRIAFVTDRFSTNLDTLEAGNYRLALIDVDTAAITPVHTFDKGKNINPQWTADGQGLYFLSDRTGITNIYRLDVASHDLFQVTDLVTGASGITSLSPALTVASGAKRIAYSVYDDGRYEVYSIDDVERLAGTRILVDEPKTAGVIPGGKVEGKLVAAQKDPVTGLGNASSFEKKPYKAKLGLDYVGQPYISGGADRYGAFFGGGIAMSFSDMLGNHSLGTVFQIDRSNGYTDVGGIVSYVNKSRRFNWGLQLDRIPYVIGGFSNGLTTVNGQQLYVEQTLLERETDTGLQAQGFYPLDSTTRFEVSTGFRNIGFNTQLLTAGYSLDTGEQLINDRQSQASQPSLNMWEGSAAIVHDTSLFGATSPILGQRLRLQVSPVVGTINYTGALADVRKYFMPIHPVTIAARILHYGRYGSGSEDPRLYPLFLGDPGLVRGYDVNSFTASECGAQADGSCPSFDRLLGSRLLVGNLEVRAPLLGLFGKRNLYGPIPIEIGAFYDTGVAWMSGSKPSLFGGSEKLVRSTGATARVNVFGFAVLQVDWVKPLDRPGKNPYFAFNLLTGF
jgi:Tol biopolymer transport system component